MNRSSARLRRAFALVVAIGVIALGGVVWTTHEQSLRLDETAGWADRTRASVAAVQAVSLAALDAESGQRGYLLGTANGLSRYRAAEERARRNLDALGAAVGADPEQAALLSRLRGAVETHLARLDQAAGLTAEHPDQARALLRDGQGVQQRRDVEGFASAMIGTEGRRFDEHIVLGRDVRHAAETWAGVALLLLVTVMAAATLFILRELKLRAAVTRALLESRGRLELGERRLRDIADNMPACIAYIDKTETYRFTNAAFTTLFGVPHEAFIGRTMTEMMGRCTRDELAPYVEDALAGRETHFERQGMALQADATFMVSYVPDVNQHGGVDGFYVMSLDITARKKTDTALADSERRLRTITDNLPATIVRMDGHGVCTYANEQMRRLYGIDPLLLVGMSHRAFRGEEEWAQIGPHVEAALQGEVRRFEVPARINGRQEWVQQSVIP